MLDPRGSHKRERVQPSFLLEHQKNPVLYGCSARARSDRGARRSARRGRVVPGRSPARQASEPGHAAAPTRRELRKMSGFVSCRVATAQNPAFCANRRIGAASVAGRAIGSTVHPERRAPCTKIRAGAQARAVARAPTKEATKRRARAAPPHSHWLCWRRRSPRTAAKPAARRRCCRRAPRYGSSCCRRSRTALRLPSSVSCPGSASRS